MKRGRNVLVAAAAAAVLCSFPAFADTVSSGNTFRVMSVTAGSASAYENIAVARVSGSVNVRSQATTSSSVVGKIYNNCAATILSTVDGEGGKWYEIKSGNVTGYIKAQYFVTGTQAEQAAREAGTEFGTISGASTLRLRQSPDLNSETLTLLAEGARYLVIGEEGNFLKIEVDADLVGYVSKDYMKTDVEFQEAVTLEEEEAQVKEKAQREKEAQAAIETLEKVIAAEQTAPGSGSSSSGTKKNNASTIIAVNPEAGGSESVAAPTIKKPETQKENTSSGTASAEVASATRTAVVAYAKQFLGNPYVYGGTSLTNGADCSGFVMSVYAHFGISTGRNSREQAAKGKEISVDSVQPGDLLFYASGSYINHVGIYIGNGQIIHASNAKTGICITKSNYRTPAKAVTFLD